MLGGRVVLCFFPYAFFRMFSDGFAQKQIGGIKGKGAEGERGDVDDGIHRPAEPGDDVPADDERAGFGTDVKHIDVRAGAVIAQRVDAEGDETEGKIDPRGGEEIPKSGARPARKEEVQPDKDENHVPGKGMDGQRPIGQAHAFGGKIGHKSAHEAERSGKGAKGAPEFSLSEKGENQTGVHRHAAKLEGDAVELIFTPADDKRIEELFIGFREQQDKSDGEQKPPVRLVRDLSEEKRRRERDRQSRQPEDEMKGAVRLGRRHFPRRFFEKAEKQIHRGDTSAEGRKNLLPPFIIARKRTKDNKTGKIFPKIG